MPGACWNFTPRVWLKGAGRGRAVPRAAGLRSHLMCSSSSVKLVGQIQAFRGQNLGLRECSLQLWEGKSQLSPYWVESDDMIHFRVCPTHLKYQGISHFLDTLTPQVPRRPPLLNWGCFALLSLGGTEQCPVTFSVVTAGEDVLWAPSGWKPGVLPDVLPWAGQLPRRVFTVPR